MKKLLGLITLFYSLCGHAQTDSLDVMISQMIMIGIGDFDRADLDEPIFQEIKEGKVGGVVLYEKNLYLGNAKHELADLVMALQQESPTPLFVSIDEEGGYVTRLKTRYGFPKNVSAAYLGELDDKDSTMYYGTQTATLLKAFGINMNYAPDVDVNINPNNPVIGKIQRSFSADYQEVSEHAYYVSKAHQKANVVPVLKHFPGHGSSKNDTHLGLADVTSSWRIEEVFPYRDLIDSGAVDAIMTAHIVNEILDNDKLPATLSKNVISGVLRGLLKYDGVVMSDDMQMGAIKNEYGMKEAIRMSIEAGVDVLMFANNVKDYDMVTASTVHGIIKELVKDGHISSERIRKSYERIMALKAKYGLLEGDFLEDLEERLAPYR